MKTFVIKLAGVVDDDSLMRLGELRMSITPVNGQSTQKFKLSAIEPIRLEITGNGTFTETGTKVLELSNPKDKIVEVTNGTFTLSLLNKEAVTKLDFYLDDYSRRFYAEANLSQVRGMLNLTYFDMELGNFYGTADDLLGLTNLTYLKVVGGRVSGDMRKIGENLTNLTTFVSLSNNIGTDTSTLSNLTKLTDLRLLGQGGSSPLSDLSSMTTLKKLYISHAGVGDISALAGLTNLTHLSLTNNTRITGSTSSLAALHPNNGGKLGTFTYTKTSVTGTWPPS